MSDASFQYRLSRILDGVDYPMLMGPGLVSDMPRLRTKRPAKSYNGLISFVFFPIGFFAAMFTVAFLSPETAAGSGRYILIALLISIYHLMMLTLVTLALFTGGTKEAINHTIIINLLGYGFAAAIFAPTLF